MAFGGLGVMMFSGPPALWSINMALRKVDLQSLFFASMFVVIIVILGEHFYHLVSALLMSHFRSLLSHLIPRLCVQLFILPNPFILAHRTDNQPT